MNKDLALLNWYKEIGIDEITSDKPNILSEDNNITSNQKRSSNNLSLKTPNELITITKQLADQADSLESLKNMILSFEGLSIKKTATNTVFSDGNPQAKIMIIGEAPGENEDLQGIPFCGQSGQLMDKMFSFVGLARVENLYITNSVFWRPPGNRKPTPEENAICLPFVEKHIALINPELLILVGSTSAQALLNSEQTISTMRTKKYTYLNKYLTKEIPVVVMFHPSYLLRQPSQKKLAWNDLLRIKKQYLQK